MKYVLIIKSAPLANQASLNAYYFAKDLLTKEHELLTVYFYQEGAYHGLTPTVIPPTETNVVQLWETLARKHKFPLIICSAAALRRGIQLPNDSLFTIASLGYLFEICQGADEVMQF